MSVATKSGSKTAARKPAAVSVASAHKGATAKVEAKLSKTSSAKAAADSVAVKRASIMADLREIRAELHEASAGTQELRERLARLV